MDIDRSRLVVIPPFGPGRCRLPLRVGCRCRRQLLRQRPIARLIYMNIYEYIYVCVFVYVYVCTHLCKIEIEIDRQIEIDRLVNRKKDRQTDRQMDSWIQIYRDRQTDINRRYLRLALEGAACLSEDAASVGGSSLYLTCFVTVFLLSGPMIFGCLGKSPDERRFVYRYSSSSTSVWPWKVPPACLCEYAAGVGGSFFGNARLLDLFTYIYMNIYLFVCVCVCVFMCSFMYVKQRQRQIER